MTLAVTGRSTSIVAELEKIFEQRGEFEPIERIDLRLELPDCAINRLPLPPAKRYLFAAGVLYSKEINEQTGDEIVASLCVNVINVVRICEMILERQDDARICVIGSESAAHMSFDLTYALGKAALHAYVRGRKTKARQQLVCLSPPIIADSGMTRRRADYPQVLTTRPYCRAVDVATLAFELLYLQPPATGTGRVIPVSPR
jgi:NADP-dependent 3-hydroxy acid dehydrogenase YdfG